MRSWFAPPRTRPTASVPLVSIGDPAALELFQIVANQSGVPVTETTALGLSAMYRAVALVSGTIGQLPIRTLADDPNNPGRPMRTKSVFDNPGGPDGPTQFEWSETAVAHLMIHGDAFLAKIYNTAGALYSLTAIHPLCVYVRWPTKDENPQPVGGKWFDVTDRYGQVNTVDARTILHIPSLSLDGLRGIGLLILARNSLGTAIAGDRAAAKLFSTGALMGGIASPDEDLDPDEVKTLKDEINKNMAGWENAGSIVVANRKMNLSPWQMTAADAQFLQSRQFSVEEIARWTGVPPHLLMQTDKQTSWGTGVAEQNRGLGRFTLAPWTSRIEQRGSRILPGRWIEYDFAGLERPDFATMVGLVIQQMTSNPPLISQDEARALLNLGPMAVNGDPNA